jgi:hypothetical protein
MVFITVSAVRYTAGLRTFTRLRPAAIEIADQVDNVSHVHTLDTVNVSHPEGSWLRTFPKQIVAQKDHISSIDYLISVDVTHLRIKDGERVGHVVPGYVTHCIGSDE